MTGAVTADRPLTIRPFQLTGVRARTWVSACVCMCVYALTRANGRGCEKDLLIYRLDTCINQTLSASHHPPPRTPCRRSCRRRRPEPCVRCDYVRRRRRLLSSSLAHHHCVSLTSSGVNAHRFRMCTEITAPRRTRPHDSVKIAAGRGRGPAKNSSNPTRSVDRVRCGSTLRRFYHTVWQCSYGLAWLEGFEEFHWHPQTLYFMGYRKRIWKYLQY